ncbi:tRNA-dihydrouridine(20/20a) synthase [invertebrate metagenome]|uniref:tRNA-dihydrouridine(20/20a) synthase n=1 Tax=invertebrate metagenome TaxID=1711999 RepID=A0A2H9T5T5_9ZZZZ
MSQAMAAMPLQEKTVSHRFCVAPMLDWTTRHCRYFHRQLSSQALLYTEMVTTGALIHGDKERFLQHDEAEYPLALQLGGSDPEALATCAGYAQEWGFQEVNINVGCPSDRVQNGRIGACLMAEPQTVAQGVQAMRDKVDIPVTVKHRIGINGHESYDELVNFVGTVAEAGCETFIVHGRIAILEGLSPKENREIPPLKPQWVYQLKKDFPHLEIIINGGITSLASISEHLDHVDGVMLGREAYQNPWLLHTVDHDLYGMPEQHRTRHDVVEAMMPYIEKQLSRDVHLGQITRHMLGLYQGICGGRRYRRYLSEHAHRPEAGKDVLLEAVHQVEALGIC